MSIQQATQKTSAEPVYVQMPDGNKIVCSITTSFTKALRHYSDTPEAAYNLLCEYASYAGLGDGALLDTEDVVRLKRFVKVG